jgi:putative redox protein
MEAKIVRMQGLTLAGKSDSNHWIVMDTDEPSGGSNASAKPIELILLGLGGCTGMDVISILQKMRVPLDRFEMELHADRAENHPKVFTKIVLEYRLFGKDIDAHKVEKAIELSKTTYCSVSAMLKKAVSIEFTYQINPS